jgi:hypothetical protein
MLAYKDPSGNGGYGPDLVRLYNRFQVTNGVSETTKENLDLRVASYCLNLGLTPETSKLAKTLPFELNLEQWYDWPYLVEAVASKYNISAQEVEAKYCELISMMTDTKIYEYKFRIFTGGL